MIKDLNIKGFGANESKVIELSPHVTSITGRSYIGKSWIIRALRWVSLNKPAGDSFINWNCKEAKAKVKAEFDGERVTRIRSKSKNIYRSTLSKKPFVAFGNNVPEDLKALINLDEINFQTQHAPPFWFCETAGEVSRQLNAIINLTLIDKTLANIDSWLRTANADSRATTTRLGLAQEQKKNLAYAIDINIDLLNLESTQKDIEENAVGRSVLLDKIELVGLYTNRYKNAAERATDGLNTMSIYSASCKITEKAENLQNLIESAQNHQTAIDRKPPSTTQLDKLQEAIEDSTEQYYELEDLIEAIEDKENQKCQTIQTAVELDTQMKKLLKGKCPICGKKMS